MCRTIPFLRLVCFIILHVCFQAGWYTDKTVDFVRVESESNFGLVTSHPALGFSRRHHRPRLETNNNHFQIIFTVHNNFPVSFDHVISKSELASLSTNKVFIFPRLVSLICDVRRSGTGSDFLRALWFPLPVVTPPTVPHSLIILSHTSYIVLLLSAR